MPLVAQHAGLGLLDATQPDLGVAGGCWSDLHRTRPRPELRCAACDRRVHAKVSPAPRRMRFFAHDSLSPDCVLNGETMAHRLLKLELASATRDAGWRAELEAAGPGYRADVLAVSPDGELRVVWEAQLAAISVDEIQHRTTTITASGARVCWVTDKAPAWLGVVPSISLTAAEDGTYTVTSGVARFTRSFWTAPSPPLTLGSFVELVCQRRVSPHQPRLPTLGLSARSAAGAGLVWTAPAYVTQEQARIERDHAETLAARTWQENIRQLVERQARLLPRVIEWVHRETGYRARVPSMRGGARWGAWAGALPVHTYLGLYALICPVPHRLTNWKHRSRLTSLSIFTASEAEAARVGRACPTGQHIVVINPDTGLSFDYSGRPPARAPSPPDPATTPLTWLPPPG